mmetsp:Transcript_13832/g.17530  ORF Transcript_13832/g.17530 Transcript_13832/m.17530 type:complete len:139 (-) Transcript_13832:1562-1978(-)
MPSKRNGADSEQKQSWFQSDSVLNRDAFGPPVQLNYPGGQPNFRSSIGACLNILVSVLTLIYFTQNLVIFFKRGNTSFTQSMTKDYYGVDSTFTEEDGFQIAIGILGTGDEFCDKNGTCVSQEKKFASLIDLSLRNID